MSGPQGTAWDPPRPSAVALSSAPRGRSGLGLQAVAPASRSLLYGIWQNLFRSKVPGVIHETSVDLAPGGDQSTSRLPSEALGEGEWVPRVGFPAGSTAETPTRKARRRAQCPVGFGQCVYSSVILFICKQARRIVSRLGKPGAWHVPLAVTAIYVGKESKFSE